LNFISFFIIVDVDVVFFLLLNWRYKHFVSENNHTNY